MPPRPPWPLPGSGSLASWRPLSGGEGEGFYTLCAYTRHATRCSLLGPGATALPGLPVGNEVSVSYNATCVHRVNTLGAETPWGGISLTHTASCVSRSTSTERCARSKSNEKWRYTSGFKTPGSTLRGRPWE